MNATDVPPVANPRVLGGRLILEDRVIEDGVVAIDGSRLSYVGPAAGWTGEPAQPAGTMAPGFVDIHCHGGGGHTVTTGDPADVADVGLHHLRHGTTAMLASLVSAPDAAIEAGVLAIAEVAESGASVLGSHLEGPFIGRDHRGAHDPAHLRAPDLAAMKRWLASGRGTVRMVTLAPELPGSEALSDLVAGAGCLVALGHTDADAATFGAALAGDSVSVVTHLFNGMAPMHHREPGPVAASLAALAAGDAHVELIADGTHLADGIIALAFTLDPGDRVVLVSDAMGAAGMDDGDYELGTTTVRVIDGTAWTTTEPPSIAGSTVHLSDVVRRCITETGIDPVRVIRAATATPARLLGLSDRGRLATGLRADLVTLDEAWRVTGVLRGGQPLS